MLQGEPLEKLAKASAILSDRYRREVRDGRFHIDDALAAKARDIAIGQSAQVDTRNGIVEGRVARIDPAVQNGTVTVDVTLTGDLPRGARPDLSVDGTVELERLNDVVFVGRPAFGQEKSTVGIFKLVEGSNDAVRTQIQLGRSSVNTIEIVSGLQPGDRVILSDMSQWDSNDRIRLN